MAVIEYGHASRGTLSRPRFWFAIAIAGSLAMLAMHGLLRRPPIIATTNTPPIVVPRVAPVQAPAPIGSTTQDCVVGSFFLLTKPKLDGAQPVFNCPSANASTQPTVDQRIDGTSFSGAATQSSTADLSQFFTITPTDPAPHVIDSPSTQPAVLGATPQT